MGMLQNIGETLGNVSEWGWTQYNRYQALQEQESDNADEVRYVVQEQSPRNQPEQNTSEESSTSWAKDNAPWLIVAGLAGAVVLATLFK